MRRLCFAIPLLLPLALTSTSRAGDISLSLVMGESWDGPQHALQAILDQHYGPGAISGALDYIGSEASDLDPWFWVGDQFSALLIREIAGNSHLNTLGWYLETGTKPVIDGVDDGVVFDGPSGPGSTVIIHLPGPMTKFGFYLNPAGPYGAVNAPEPEVFFTNRLYNDQGPDGSGAIHAPVGGDVQALVFDVSAFSEPHTWLVCFEDLDSGAHPGEPGQSETDNDFNDFIFEVTAFGATPAMPLTFGALKALYLK